MNASFRKHVATIQCKISTGITRSTTNTSSFFSTLSIDLTTIDYQNPPWLITVPTNRSLIFLRLCIYASISHSLPVDRQTIFSRHMDALVHRQYRIIAQKQIDLACDFDTLTKLYIFIYHIPRITNIPIPVNCFSSNYNRLLRRFMLRAHFIIILIPHLSIICKSST